MSVEETDNNTDEPCTSNFRFDFFDSTIAEFFGKLAINGENADEDKIQNDDKMPTTTTKTRQSEPSSPLKATAYKNGRFTPYHIPINIRWRRPSLTRSPHSSADSDQMSKVCLKGDVEPLRLCLMDRKELITTCSAEANRPPTPDNDIDELSEYFEHFVRVDLKMSALAESMYV